MTSEINKMVIDDAIINASARNKIVNNAMSSSASYLGSGNLGGARLG